MTDEDLFGDSGTIFDIPSKTRDKKKKKSDSGKDIFNAKDDGMCFMISLLTGGFYPVHLLFIRNYYLFYLHSLNLSFSVLLVSVLLVFYFFVIFKTGVSSIISLIVILEL